MSGGGGSSSTIEKSDPWAGQQPYLNYGFQQALSNHQAGGPQFFQNRTYTPFSDQTQQAFQMTEDRATNGSPVNDAFQGYVTDSLSQRANTGNLNGYLDAQLQGNPSLQGGAEYAGVGGGGPQLNQTAQQALTQSAGGQMLNANPHLDQMYDQAAGRVTRNYREAVNPSIAAQFSLAGRTGSNAHQSATARSQQELGDSLGGLASNIYGQNYQQERSNQLNAANSLNSQGLQAYGLGSQDDLSRRGLGAQVYGQQAGLQQGAAGLQNSVNQGIQSAQGRAGVLAPQAANVAYDDAARLGAVGAAVEDKGQQALNDQIDRFDHYQNLPNQNLANYTAAIQGNYGGTSQTTSRAARASTTQRAAGGALSGAAVGAATGAKYGGYWGAAIGGLAGLFL